MYTVQHNCDKISNSICNCQRSAFGAFYLETENEIKLVKNTHFIALKRT